MTIPIPPSEEANGITWDGSKLWLEGGEGGPFELELWTGAEFDYTPHTSLSSSVTLLGNDDYETMFNCSINDLPRLRARVLMSDMDGSAEVELWVSVLNENQMVGITTGELMADDLRAEIWRHLRFER